MTEWRTTVRSPGYPEELVLAFHTALDRGKDPIAAYADLLDAATGSAEAPALFACRLELAALVVAPGLVPSHSTEGEWDVAKAVGRWPECRKAFGELFASSRPALAREAVARVRDGRLALDVAVRFAVAQPDRPVLALIVLGLNGGDPGAARYWAETPLVAGQDPVDLRPLARESALTPAELSRFFDALPGVDPRNDGIISARLAACRDTQLEALGKLVPGDVSLRARFNAAGLGCGPGTLGADLGRLTHAKSRAEVERVLSEPPTRPPALDHAADLR